MIWILFGLALVVGWALGIVSIFKSSTVRYVSGRVFNSEIRIRDGD